MTKLTLDRQDLILALTSNLGEHDAAYYLDTEAGELILFCEDFKADPSYGIPEDIAVNPRYLEIIPFRSHDTFPLMEDFVSTLPEGEIANRLTKALEGKKPFRRFKDTLYDYPDIQDKWYQFEDAALTKMTETWCEENDIEFEWKKLG